MASLPSSLPLPRPRPALRLRSSASVSVFALAAAVVALVASVASAQTYPPAPLPYSTTLLRTHHYASALYLSVGEELSVKGTADGHTWEAYMIAPGWPFDLRDDPVDPTVVLGLRVVYEYTQTNYTIWYYATDVAGDEECILYATYPYRPFQPTAQGDATVRGIETEVWVDTDPATTTTTTHYLTPDLGGRLYPFRIHVAYPEGSSEIEWTLDHGTHYAVLQDAWFNTSGCTDTSARTTNIALKRAPRPHPHNPWMF